MAARNSYELSFCSLCIVHCPLSVDVSRRRDVESLVVESLSCRTGACTSTGNYTLHWARLDLFQQMQSPTSINKVLNKLNFRGLKKGYKYELENLIVCNQVMPRFPALSVTP